MSSFTIKFVTAAEQIVLRMTHDVEFAKMMYATEAYRLILEALADANGIELPKGAEFIDVRVLFSTFFDEGGDED